MTQERLSHEPARERQRALEPSRRRRVDGGGRELTMGRYILLWLLGVPIPVLVLIWAFGGLH